MNILMKMILQKYVDENNGYRYYETRQLIEISRIIYLKQIGLTIAEIKQIIIKHESLESLLKTKKEELKKYYF